IGRRVRLARRRPLVAAALALALGGGIAAIIVLIGGSSAAASGIPANSVGLIDAKNNRVRKTVDIHKSPFAVAVGEGSVWITNARRPGHWKCHADDSRREQPQRDRGRRRQRVGGESRRRNGLTNQFRD